MSIWSRSQLVKRAWARRGWRRIVELATCISNRRRADVVGSLWNVPDKPTQMLMDRFYANLWNPEKKMPKLAALVEAQRWILREGRSQPGMARGIDLGTAEPAAAANSSRLPPFYWGAFVLSGDWR